MIIYHIFFRCPPVLSILGLLYTHLAVDQILTSFWGKNGQPSWILTESRFQPRINVAKHSDFFQDCHKTGNPPARQTRKRRPVPTFVGPQNRKSFLIMNTGWFIGLF